MRNLPLRRALAASVLLAVASSGTAWGQTSFGGTPPSFTARTRRTPPTQTFFENGAALVRMLSVHAAKHEPYRFGHEIDVALGTKNSGVWERLANGARLWRLRIHSGDALSLNLVFDRFHLPDGAELYIYDDRRSQVLGAYNALNNRPNGQFATELIHADALTLEYYEPRGVEFAGEIRLSQVVHGFKEITVLVQPPPPAENKSGGTGNAQCEIDVTCPEGAAWTDQINAVTRVIRGGVSCTGMLVNNTSQDGTQYYITAEHCGNMTNAVFYLNYEKPNCLQGSAPSSHTVQGATELVVDAGPLDYRFIRINEAIPAAYKPFFAGWDRGGAVPASTVTVHHPQGLPKKISFDYDPPVKNGTDWHILQWDLGVTEQGSSGAPLFDPTGRFIGHLWGGAAACGFPFDDYFVRLENYFGAVQQYLDPLGTGATTIPGYDPNACVTPISYGTPETGSSGTPAVIGTSGGDPYLGNPAFALTLAGGVPNQLACAFAARNAQVANLPFGTVLVGNLDLAWQWFFTDGSGQLAVPVNVDSSLVGQTWHFQFIVRDPGFGGGAQCSDALILKFCQ